MTFKLQTQVDDALALSSVCAWPLLRNKIVEKGIRMLPNPNERGIGQICSESSYSVTAVTPLRPRRHADSSKFRMEGSSVTSVKQAPSGSAGSDSLC